MLLGKSERLLPFPKSDIEVALITLALSCHKAGDEEGRELALGGYLELAQFIPYEKFLIVKQFYVRGWPEALTHEDIKKDDFLLIQKDIVEEMTQRKKKIAEILKGD